LVGTTGKAYAPNPNEPSILIDSIPSKGNYWVIDTGYKYCSLDNSCEKEFTFVTEYLWILSRERILDKKLIALAKDIVHSYAVDILKFTATDQ
jgi:lipocalin